MDRISLRIMCAAVCAGPFPFSCLSPETGGTDHCGWRGDGLGSQFIRENDAP